MLCLGSHADWLVKPYMCKYVARETDRCAAATRRGSGALRDVEIFVKILRAIDVAPIQRRNCRRPRDETATA
jgi:hypothetical protein